MKPTRVRLPISPLTAAVAVLPLLIAAAALPAPEARAQEGTAAPAASPADIAGAAPVSGRITLYTSVTEDTVEAVLAALALRHPDLAVDVFRAPTGELDARLASELRSGGIGADVLWLSDPLSMQRYEAEGMLQPLERTVTDAVPESYREASFVGTRLLNLVIAVRPDLEPMPTAWQDLTDPAHAGRVAIPDPGFAGSAFAALGTFAAAEDFGLSFYERLAENGAVSVASPVDVMTGVAEGRFDVGITLDKLVRDAIAAGSPLELVWPEPGAIAVHSPVAITAASPDPAAAHAFVEFLVSPEGQAAIASSGWQPVRDDIEWPVEGPVISPDWGQMYGEQQELLEAYRAIFGD